MSTGGDIPSLPERPDTRDRPRIGRDEWVATHEGRTTRERRLVRAYDRVPPPAKLGLLAVAAIPIPFFLSTGDLYAFGFFTVLYALLGLGLNVTVGFAGLLDLGYVAFFGYGAYAYAIFASKHYDLHVQGELLIPLIILGTGLAGLLLGLPSRRLLGDYLAIVTLFFGQAFVFFTGVTNYRGLTGGANGIADVDPLNFFGLHIRSFRGYYWFTLGVFLLVLAALWSLLRSRTGRAWQALREDPLAAELMGMPVNRLKLSAFAIGAGIAGLAGCIFAASSGSVASGTFDVPLLITIYAIVILGGLGSLTGVVVGAIVITVSYEMLRPETPALSRLLFYGTLLVVVLWRVRPWTRLVFVIGGTIAFGFAVYAIVGAIDPTATSGSAIEGGRLTGLIESFVVIPAHPGRWPEYGYVVLIALVLILTRLHGWWRTAAMPPTIYLAMFVWENLLMDQPSVTRLIVFGALLVVLMVVRPQGLLGTARVEIV
jgi:ABC-type branched-subunit amino acid transport system permease subunit